MVNLEELYISHNGIEEIEGLDNLVSQTNDTRFQICLVRPNLVDRSGQFSHSRSRSLSSSPDWVSCGVFVGKAFKSNKVPLHSGVEILGPLFSVD